MSASQVLNPPTC